MEKVEAVFKKNGYVEQIWVYGNSYESQLVAVVVPIEVLLLTFLVTNKDREQAAWMWSRPGCNSYESQLVAVVVPIEM